MSAVNPGSTPVFRGSAWRSRLDKFSTGYTLREELWWLLKSAQVTTQAESGNLPKREETDAGSAGTQLARDTPAEASE
jgi:hypothetical protein